MRELLRKLLPPSAPGFGGSLAEWRERILMGVLRVALVFGLVVYAPSVFAAVRDRLWGVLVVDTLALAWTLRLTLSRALSHRRKALELLVAFYLVAVSLLVQVGPVS